MSTAADLNRAYRAALLITASRRGAEFAVIRAIEKDPGAMVRNTVIAALSWRGPADAGGCDVQPALKRVLALPRAQRHCYVLRILEGIPACRCSRLLHLRPAEVDAAAASAASAGAFRSPPVTLRYRTAGALELA